jgi:transposase
LRKAALGRKNFLFVGHEAAGENLAGLYALVSTCEANGVNPEEYLADVLLRVQTHPQSRISELLPHEWKRLRATNSS